MSECRLIGRHLHLHEPTTGSLAATGDAAVLRSPLAIGAAAGNVLQFGDLAGRPGDQAADDGRSHTFTSCPLTERVEILGPASVELLIDADQPTAQLSVRLCEVTHDGASRLVTTGALNLTHRHGHAAPEALEPGRPYRVTVPLFATGHAFGAGNRIRLSVSASFWPWPLALPHSDSGHHPSRRRHAPSAGPHARSGPRRRADRAAGHGRPRCGRSRG